MTPRRHTLVAVAAAGLLLVAMVALSTDFGFTWDERFQQHYGEQIWDYYHGRLPRSEFDTDLGNQFLYGGLVEVLCVAAQHALPSVDVYEVRHMVIAVFGWLGIVCCGLLAGRAFGRRAGWLAALLLAISPRFLGDAMNNPKDAPFAALTMAALYWILTIDEQPPHWSRPRLAGLALTIALAVNVRPLGLVLPGFAALVLVVVATRWVMASESGLQTSSFRRQASGFRLAASGDEGRRWLTYAASLARFAIVTIVAVAAGTLAWPWAQANPLWRPIQAFLIATRLDWASGFDVLYGGESLGAGQLPWHYVPRWLGMALPPVVLAGLALSWLAWRLGGRARFVISGLVLFVALPLAGAIVRHATIYDGIRHILFVVPPLTVLAAGGWEWLLRLPRRAALVAAAVLAIGIVEPVVFQIRNHPNQIVYFSPLVGGPQAAFARYDMDYWGNCMLQAVTWSANVAKAMNRPLGVSGNPIQAVQADAGRYRTLFVSPRNAVDFHFDIRLMRGPPGALREFAARSDALYRVTTADGAPLCVVLPGPSFPSIAAAMPHLE